jgi:hypothetical protein
MERAEAKSAVKALYLQAAALAGFEVTQQSPERLSDLVEEGFGNVDAARRPEAVANVLMLIAETLKLAQSSGDTVLSDSNVDAAKESLCPVYPFK